MKKNILIISLLTAVVLGSFTFAFASLLPQRDHVQFSETVLYGDPKAAEGLTLNYKNRFNGHLFWDTTWTIGTPAESAVTDYQFFARDYVESEIPDAGIEMKSISSHFDNLDGALEKAYEELTETAKPNEKNIRQISIADYYKYYPVSASIDLPGWHSFTIWSNGLSVDESFQDFFRIPVLPDDTMEVQVWVNGSGEISSRRASYGTDTLYSMDTESAFTDDTCYFTFTTRSRTGQYVDTSLIPGGFGIYALPYSQDDIQLNRISMVYPLDPKVQIVAMEVNSDDTSLFFFTYEEDGYYFTEIELDTMKTLQRLRINDPHILYGSMLHVADDYFAVCCIDYQGVTGYRIFSRGEDGKFKFDFLIPSPSDKEREFFNFYSEATFAYDGERAALTGTAVSTSHWSTAFTVAVYDETGMLYCGEYNTGQNCRESSHGQYDCVPVANELAYLSWQ